MITETTCVIILLLSSTIPRIVDNPPPSSKDNGFAKKKRRCRLHVVVNLVFLRISPCKDNYRARVGGCKSVIEATTEVCDVEAWKHLDSSRFRFRAFIFFPPTSRLKQEVTFFEKLAVYGYSASPPPNTPTHFNHHPSAAVE